jgi:predicted amidohydrolase YtcJ
MKPAFDAGFAFLEDENMDATQVERRKMVTLPQEEFEEILERAAERGARHALHGVGLDGEDAAHDIRELRNLLDAFNEAKKTAGLTIVKMLVTGLVMALLAGAFVKLKLFGGAQ